MLSIMPRTVTVHGDKVFTSFSGAGSDLSSSTSSFLSRLPLWSVSYSSNISFAQSWFSVSASAASPW
jgi:hypothetical protein